MSGASVTVTLPDGTQKQTAAGTTIGDFVRDSIGPGLAKAAVLAKANDTLVDLSRKLDRDTKLAVITSKDPVALETIRHDAAHIVADAVQRLFPGTQVTIGPSIENGFYYDFDRGQPFTEEDLARIEALANEIVAADLKFQRTEVSPEQAIALFDGKGEKFKVEIIQDIVGKGATVLTLYNHGEWVDFCEGPHGPSTGRVGVIKLLSSSAAYWRGDHRNKTLQRIYGTAFFDEEGPRRVAQAARGGREARSPAPRQGSRSVPLPSAVAGRRVLGAERHGDLHGAVELHAQAGAVERLRRDQDPAALQQGPVGDVGPLGQVQGEHVPRRGQRGEGRGRSGSAPLLAQADELPVASSVLRLPQAELSRSPAAAAFAGRAASQRGGRLARRPDARAPVRCPGRTRISTAAKIRFPTR